MICFTPGLKWWCIEKEFQPLNIKVGKGPRCGTTIHLSKLVTALLSLNKKIAWHLLGEEVQVGSAADWVLNWSCFWHDIRCLQASHTGPWLSILFSFAQGFMVYSYGCHAIFNYVNNNVSHSPHVIPIHQCICSQ